MKIASKISSGFGILIALIVAVLSYQVTLFLQMQSINRSLSTIDFHSAILSVQLLRALDQVEEFSRKFFVTGGDPDYAAQTAQMRDAFSDGLKELNRLPLSPDEKVGIERVSDLWSRFSAASIDGQTRYKSLSPDDAEKALGNLIDLLSRLRVEVQATILASQRTIESRVEESSIAAHRAERISWWASGLALVLSLAVSLWIIRSISGPLRELTAGTRAVAEGKFFYQLDSSRNDELAQLAGDFNVMTRRLSELDGLKKDFVSHVSHELKTPLASIEETIRLLLDGIAGPLNAEQRRFLEMNLLSSRRLSSLIRNLLDISRMEAGVMRYEMKRHDFAGLVRTALAEFEAPFLERSVGLDIRLPDTPLPVACDAERMTQVVGNLVGNALKFSPRGGSLSVTLERLEDLPQNLPAAASYNNLQSPPAGDGYALLAVADKGPGVPVTERERIFQKFHQVKGNQKGSKTGVGLGLAISRTIVEAHHGAIWVGDNPGGGSIFYVLLASGSVREATSVSTSSPL